MTAVAGQCCRQWGTPTWHLDHSGYRPREQGLDETLYALANGYLGTRATLDFESEQAVPGVFLSSVYDWSLTSRSEIVNLPNWLPVQPVLDLSGPVAWEGADVRRLVRRLCLRHGVARLELDVRLPDDREVRFETETLVHRTRRRVAMLTGRLTPLNFGGVLALASSIDWRRANTYLGGLQPAVETAHCATAVADTGDRLGLRVRTKGTERTVAVATRLVVAGARDRSVQLRYRCLTEAVAVAAEPGQPIAFTKYAAYADAAPGTDPYPAATRELDLAYASGADRLRTEHAGAWVRLWRDCDAEIDGDPAAQRAMRFALFHLFQAVELDHPVQAIPARGLSSEYHSGHVFFNTELFKLPVFSYLHPPVAAALLRFRRDTLDQARQHARDGGYGGTTRAGLPGARFPEEADADGAPATPWRYRDVFTGDDYAEWSGSLTYFNSATVAYATWRHFQVTGDTELLWRLGLELILETAKFAAGLFTWDPARRSHVIRDVMGPDEYHYHVDNSYFVNYLLRWNVQVALEVVDRLSGTDAGRVAAALARTGVTERTLADWRRLVASMYLPAVVDGVIEQFEGYLDLPDQRVESWDGNGRPVLSPADRQRADLLHPFRTQLVKEADVVLLLSLFPAEFPDPVQRASLDYYLDRTVHESSLSASPYGVVAARLGRADVARRMFLLSAAYNLDYRPREDYRNGLHLAAYGGAWQVLAHGFLGIRPAGDRLVLAPSALPAGWTRLVVRLRWRGSRLKLAHSGDVVEATLLAGPPVSLSAGDRHTELTAGAVVVPVDRGRSSANGRSSAREETR